MAAPTILVSPETLRGHANAVRNFKSDHDGVMQQLTSLINSLEGEWKGEAQQALYNEYHGMQSTFNAFSELLNQFAVQMDEDATSMETRDQELAASTRSKFQ